MVKMTHYVNGHFEMLEACGEIACYADERDLFVDKLTIQNTGGDNWIVDCELIPLMPVTNFGELDF